MLHACDNMFIHPEKANIKTCARQEPEKCFNHPHSVETVIQFLYLK